jgi:inositol hexakisphosphate/diphosphoinositol-pentakisphosphate kinase
MMQGDFADEEEDTGSLSSIHPDALGPDGVVLPTTLLEGAIPVREMPDQLLSEPASMGSSLVDEREAMERHMTLPGSHQEELRCVIAVIRHGDRTPKQKLKVDTSEPLILKYFADHTDNCRKDLKIKARTPLVQFLKTVKAMIAEKEAEAARRENREMLNKLRLMRDILEKWKIGGINRKLQIKPKNWEEFIDEEGETHVRATEVQLILKWGGNCKVSCCFFSSHFARFSFSLGNLTSFTSFSLHVVTKLGEKQAIQLGQRLRHEMYPDSPGGGILRLHSTFRHDLKIKTSDEGRVMKTAAAFAKGLLELEGEIPPILVSLVHKETDSLHMLDPSGNKEVRKELDQCKERINVNLQQDVNYEKLTLAEREELVGPASSVSLHEGLRKVGNPRKTLFNIHETIGELLLQLDEMLGVMASGDENRIEGGEGLKGEDDHEMALSGVKLYKGETLLELTERWRYLYGRLYDEEKDLFDLSRVPDVHDNVRFE